MLNQFPTIPIATRIKCKATRAVIVAKIKDKYFESIEDALLSSKENDVIEIVAMCVTFPDELVINHNISIVSGNNKKRIIVGAHKITVNDVYLTCENLVFSQNDKTLVFKGGNVSFTECEFNFHMSNVQSKVDFQSENIKYLGLLSFSECGDVSFRGCLFDGRSLFNRVNNVCLIYQLSVNNLDIDNCTFINAYVGVFEFDINGYLTVTNSEFLISGYSWLSYQKASANTAFINNTFRGRIACYASEKLHNRMVFKKCIFNCAERFGTYATSVDTTFYECRFQKRYWLQLKPISDNKTKFEFHHCKTGHIKIDDKNAYDMFELTCSEKLSKLDIEVYN